MTLLSSGTLLVLSLSLSACPVCASMYWVWFLRASWCPYASGVQETLGKGQGTRQWHKEEVEHMDSHRMEKGDV